MPATRTLPIADIARLLPQTKVPEFGPAAVRLAFEGLTLLQKEMRSGKPRRASAATHAAAITAQGTSR